jgi:hypothetical protein
MMTYVEGYPASGINKVATLQDMNFTKNLEQIEVSTFKSTLIGLDPDVRELSSQEELMVLTLIMEANKTWFIIPKEKLILSIGQRRIMSQLIASIDSFLILFYV